MTVLERMKRRKEKEASVKSPVRKFSRKGAASLIKRATASGGRLTGYILDRSYDLIRKSAAAAGIGGNNDKKGYRSKPIFDIATSIALVTLTERHIQQVGADQSNSKSLSHLLTHKTIVDAYCDALIFPDVSDQHDRENVDSLRRLEQIGQSIKPSPTVRRKIEYQRRYQLNHARNVLQTLISSNHTSSTTASSTGAAVVTSWQHAFVEYFARVVTFPRKIIDQCLRHVQKQKQQDEGLEENDDDQHDLVVLASASGTGTTAKASSGPYSDLLSNQEQGLIIKQQRQDDVHEQQNELVTYNGYYSNQSDRNGNAAVDDSVELYRRRLEKVHIETSANKVGLTEAERMLHGLANRHLSSSAVKLTDRILFDQLDKEYAERDDRLKSDAVKASEAALKEQEQAEEAQKRLSLLLRPLTDEESDVVHDALYGYGIDTEIVAKDGADSIQRVSIQRLRPGVWLNDEIIHFFLVVLSKRDADLCAQDPSQQRKRCHFFKSFFMTKLLNEGHRNPDMDGVYEYKNVKRWSKNAPGKDIFNLDKIFFPINIHNSHWICAVAYIQEKRIQIYDSMGSSGHDYLNHIFRYLQDEHLAKKNSPMPDLEEWKLIPTEADTPRQVNCDDCGVFTCMFCDFLSMGYPLAFDQSHITQCRERIALSIMKGKATV